jgi:hypothetical protein
VSERHVAEEIDDSDATHRASLRVSVVGRAENKKAFLEKIALTKAFILVLGAPDF